MLESFSSSSRQSKKAFAFVSRSIKEEGGKYIRKGATCKATRSSRVYCSLARISVLRYHRHRHRRRSVPTRISSTKALYTGLGEAFFLVFVDGASWQRDDKVTIIVAGLASFDGVSRDFLRRFVAGCIRSCTLRYFAGYSRSSSPAILSFSLRSGIGCLHEIFRDRFQLAGIECGRYMQGFSSRPTCYRLYLLKPFRSIVTFS